MPQFDFLTGAMRLRYFIKANFISPILSVAMLATFSALLAGCGAQGVSDDKLGRFLVSPDKYEYYNCDQLAVEAKTKSTREAELEALTAKAGRDASGKFASALAYRPEYLQVHGEMNELRKASAAKNCGSAAGAASSAPPSAGSQRR